MKGYIKNKYKIASLKFKIIGYCGRIISVMQAGVKLVLLLFKSAK